MVTMKPGNYINEYYGLTTDTKPTDPYLPNASIFYEMDTGDIYLYDAANGEWVLQPSWEGGGGSTVEIDTTLTRAGAAADAKAAGAGINAVKAALAPEFDEDEYYSAGTFVWHDGVLYFIGNEHDSGVSWEDTDPFPVVIADELTAIWNAVDNPFIFDILMSAVATRFDEAYDYAKDAIVWGPSGELYRLPYGHVSGESWNQTSALLVCVSDDYIRRINNIRYHIADYFSVLDYLPPQSFVWYEDSLYYLPYGHTSGALWENTNHVHVSLANKIRENLTSLNRMIASARENTSTASRSYAIGDYVISGDILYKVIAAITTGGTLRDGINVVQTDVMAEIAGNAGLASATKAAIAQEFDENEYYPAGTPVWHDGALYAIFVEHDSGISWEDTITGTVVIGDAMRDVRETLDRVAFSNAIAYQFEENVDYVKDALVWQYGGLYRLPYGHKAGVAWGNFMVVPANLSYELESRLRFLRACIAPIYDQGVTHSAQSYVWYNDELYKLLSDHAAGTAWDTVQKTKVTLTDWIPEEVQIDTTLKRAGAAADAKATGDAINQLGSGVGQSISAAANQLGNGINMVKYAVAQEFDESKVHDVMSYVWHDGKLYRIDSAHAPGVTWENTVCTEVILADEMTSMSASASLAINNLSTSVAELKAEIDASTVTVTGTDPAITAEPNTRYVCGEVHSIYITPPTSGICDVTFTSGSTATVLTVPNTVRFPSWFDATTLEANTIYEINISDGLAAVMSWAS